jgi:type VI protein secretion system component VasK
MSTKELIKAILEGNEYIEKFNELWNTIVINKLEEMKVNMAENMFSEDVEPLDELAPSTIQNYAKANARQQAGAKQHINTDSPFKQHAQDMLNKRKKGMESVAKRAEKMTVESKDEWIPEKEPTSPTKAQSEESDRLKKKHGEHVKRALDKISDAFAKKSGE